MAQQLQCLADRLDAGGDPHQGLEITLSDLLELLEPANGVLGHAVGSSPKHRSQLLLDLLGGQAFEVNLADIDDEALQPVLHLVERKAERPGGSRDGVIEAREDQRELALKLGAGVGELGAGRAPDADPEELLGLLDVAEIAGVEPAAQHIAQRLGAAEDALAGDRGLGAKQ